MNRFVIRFPVQKRSFTLIELLTVVAIIAVIAGMLLAAIPRVKQQAKNTQARADIRAIEAAIIQYFTEYGKLPITNSQQGVSCDWYYGTNYNATCSGSPPYGLGYQYNVIDTLRAISTSGHDNYNHVLNPRRIAFLDTPNRKNAIDGNGYFLDPWGAIYWLKLDNNYNNLIEYYTSGSETIAKKAIVISYGYNGTQDDPTASGTDDIVSYR